MSAINDIYEAINVYSTPIRVHPDLNMLDERLDDLGQQIPLKLADLTSDDNYDDLLDPVVPRSSAASSTINQNLANSGSSIPRQLAWYSENNYRLGTIVEYDNKIYQIDQIANYDQIANIYVYFLKGDDTIAPV